MTKQPKPLWQLTSTINLTDLEFPVDVSGCGCVAVSREMSFEWGSPITCAGDQDWIRRQIQGKHHNSSLSVSRLTAHIHHVSHSHSFASVMDWILSNRELECGCAFFWSRSCLVFSHSNEKSSVYHLIVSPLSSPEAELLAVLSLPPKSSHPLPLRPHFYTITAQL